VSDDERQTPPETPLALASRDDRSERATVPPPPDPREAEFELAGGVFTTARAREVYRRQMDEAKARGYDDHHRVCAELVADVRREDQRRHEHAEHRWNGRFQAILLELQETRAQLEQTQAALVELSAVVARHNAGATR